MVNKIRSETVAQSYDVKKMFLESFKKPQENTCGRVSFLIKLHA